MNHKEAAFPNLLVVIGASAGGLEPIRQIISHLPESFQATVIVATHRNPAETQNRLAEILSHDARLKVREPVEGESLDCTTLYVGRPSSSLRIDGRIAHLDDVASHLERLQRIDELFLSAARYAGENAVGVILSGTLSDGVEGLKAIHAAGGKCIVQDPADAIFDDMPQNALNDVPVDYVATPVGIAGILIELAAERSCQ